MALLTCDVCGNKLIGKPDGIFECSACGVEYSLEWAKQKLQNNNMQISTVDVASNIPNQTVSANVSALVKRGNMALSDGKWDEAEGLFKQALNINAENADAYIGLCMASAKSHNKAEYEEQWPFSRQKSEKDFHRAQTYASGNLSTWINNLVNQTEEFKAKAASMRAHIKYTFPLISAGGNHTVGLKTDGTILAVGEQKHGIEYINSSVPRALEWTNIKGVYAGDSGIWGLKNDGTVTRADEYLGHYHYYYEWSNVVDVAVGPYQIVALTSDGKVKIDPKIESIKCDIENLCDVVHIAVGPRLILAVKSDGTVVKIAEENAPAYDVSGWKNIVAVFSGASYTVGLKSDGTVEAIEHKHHYYYNGDSGYDVRECTECKNWDNIVGVSVGEDHLVALKSDCTVVAIGKNDDGQCDVNRWTNIVAVSAGKSHTVGLKADGTVVAIGTTRQKECNVDSWKLFQALSSFTQEKEEGIRNIEKTRCKIEQNILLKENQSLLTERKNLQEELSNSKGLLAKLLRADNEEKLSKVENELRNNNIRLEEIERYLNGSNM